MQVCLLKSKIHRATMTDGNLKYGGGLTIASDLMHKCGLIPYERILWSHLANGNRFETYAIPGEPGSGQICVVFGFLAIFLSLCRSALRWEHIRYAHGIFTKSPRGVDK